MNTNPEVDAWFDDYEHPLIGAMQAEPVRSPGKGGLLMATSNALS